MSKRRKAAIVIICIIAAFIVACVVTAPYVFRVDRYRPYVILLIEQKTGRRVEIGHLGLTVFPSINIRVDGLALSNPPGFPAGNWLTVKRIHARLDLGALLHHQIVIRSLDLSNPVLNLISNARGNWNYQLPTPRPIAANDLPHSDSHAGPAIQDPPLFTLQEISKVSLQDGILIMASLAPDGRPSPPAIQGEGVSTNLKDISLAAFANPQSAGGNLATTTGNLNVKALYVSNLQLTNITSPVEASPAQVRLSDVKFDFYGGRGKTNVLLNLTTPVLEYSAQGELNGVNTEKLLEGFPQARGQLTGTLESHFTFSGQSTSSPDPWAGKQGQGMLVVRKGRLLKLQLNKSLLNLAHIAQIGPAKGDPSAFSVISLDWQLANSLLTTRNVHIAGNGMEVNGSGTMDLAGPGRINYEGVAEFAAQRNPLTNILIDVSGANFANGKLGLPFIVDGTLQKPLVRLKSSAIFNRSLAVPNKNINTAPKTIENLLNAFTRKK